MVIQTMPGGLPVHIKDIIQLEETVQSVYETFIKGNIVHIKDMIQLEKTVQSVYETFKKGNIILQKKSTHVLSNKVMDQTHGQMIDVKNGGGGVIGITFDKMDYCINCLNQ